MSSTTSGDYEFRYIDIGSVDFHKGIMGYEVMKYKDSPSRARRIVKKGDLIVSTVRTYLRAIVTIEDDEDTIVSTGFAVLTPINVNEKYLEYLTKTEYFISEVIKNSVGVSYPAINSKELLEGINPDYYTHFIISTQNYPTFYNRKNIPAYNKFFRIFYLEKEKNKK